jgi:hypothetical protein
MTIRLRTTLAGAAATTAALVLLSGCGSDSKVAADPAGSAPTGASDSGMPACDSVWVAGRTLPQKYHGCTAATGPVAPVRHRCEFGVSIVLYDNRYYAVPGHRINETSGLDSSHRYHSALRSCQG